MPRKKTKKKEKPYRCPNCGNPHRIEYLGIDRKTGRQRFGCDWCDHQWLRRKSSEKTKVLYPGYGKRVPRRKK